MSICIYVPGEYAKYNIFVNMSSLYNKINYLLKIIYVYQ